MARDTAGLTPAMTFDFLPKRLRRFGTQNRMKIMLVLISRISGTRHAQIIPRYKFLCACWEKTAVKLEERVSPETANTWSWSGG